MSMNSKVIVAESVKTIKKSPFGHLIQVTTWAGFTI